jgi:urea carboxylase
MKAECDVNSPTAGVVTVVYAQPGQAIAAGAPIVAIAPDLPAIGEAAA